MYTGVAFSFREIWLMFFQNLNFMKYLRFIKLFNIRQMSRLVDNQSKMKINENFDKEQFNRTISCVCLVVQDSKKTSKILPDVKSALFKAKKFKSIVEEDQKSMIYLDQKLMDKEKIDLNKLIKDYKEKQIDVEIMPSKEIHLTYENISVDEAFKKILPEGELLSGYTQIGHIVHLNLRDELLDLKYQIGQILLDKVTGCRTVVNKCEIIENQFRNLSFELLAGEDNYETRHRENGLTFELDFSKVFWNSRLSTEREKLMKKFNRRDLIYDVFAGVGPFAISAAVKKNCTVVANDLNPDCVRYLERNIILNKSTKNVERVHNMDAGRFLDDIVSKDLKEKIKNEFITKGINRIHFIMNLPAIASDFLSHFVGILKKTSSDEEDLSPDVIPVTYIHCYMFCKGDDDVLEAEIRVEKAFGERKIDDLNVEFVRNVAPSKNMMRASFQLHPDIMLDGKM